jgi:hypothetical protein
MAKYFEVCFRGESEKHLFPWRPTVESCFECASAEARERFDDLVEAGEESRAVDGMIPYVVEIRRVKRWFDGHDTITKIDSMLVSYAEPDAIQWGPWAAEAPPDPATLN